jgi:hypothetical protein
MSTRDPILGPPEIVREDMADILVRASDFRNIDILTYTRGDLIGLVNQRIAAIRICVVLTILRAREDRNQTSRSEWTVDIGIDCLENVLIARNAGTPTAWSLGSSAGSELKMRKGAWGGICTPHEEGWREVPAPKEYPQGVLIVRGIYTTKIAGKTRSSTD